jgi:transketolase
MKSIQLAKEIRKKSIELVYQASASHIGGALSMTDILAVLYTDILRFDAQNPAKEDRDRLILSKGHCCSALYAVLAIKGFFSVEELKEYGQEGSRLTSHISHYVPGVEISAGSLGHGLPIACGLALAAKRKFQNHKIYCIVGDGEMDEGSNWEAILFGSHHKLDNLCLIIDYNRLQGLGYTNEVLNLEPLRDKLLAFNWNCLEIDGHNHQQIKNAFEYFSNNPMLKPMAIIAHTIKGKGVKFMENQLLWHYRSPKIDEFNQAITEIEKNI